MDSSLVAWQQPTSPAAEAFRQFGAIAAATTPEERLLSIGITSPTGAVGKSATAANLAVALAQRGAKVVLVDADLRAPALHTLFQADNTSGLSVVLGGGASPASALQDSGIPQLSLLTAGPATSDSHRLLAGADKASLFNELKQQADYVVVDLPPVLGRSDALELAPLLDGVFLVLRAGSSKREEGQQAKTLLQRVNVSILGIVFSNTIQ